MLQCKGRRTYGDAGGAAEAVVGGRGLCRRILVSHSHSESRVSEVECEAVL